MSAFVMTGSAADPAAFQPHIHPNYVRRKLKLRAKDPNDPLEIVIVRDMWLTGFDAPAVHTMYVDKPMQGAGLMQAIARVNRTFRDKPGGLIVDYIGIATNLRWMSAAIGLAAGSGIFLVAVAATVLHFTLVMVVPYLSGGHAGGRTLESTLLLAYADGHGGLRDILATLTAGG